MGRKHGKGAALNVINYKTKQSGYKDIYAREDALQGIRGSYQHNRSTSMPQTNDNMYLEPEEQKGCNTSSDDSQPIGRCEGANPGGKGEELTGSNHQLNTF
uniref:Uncharacterized protein n=1 Tax=Solanum tuberosum TaxID=4113 RepID=M1AZI4_SOLTU